MLTSAPAWPKRRLALSLMISSSLTLAAVGLAAPAYAQDPMDAFASSPYNYCDAKLIAELWGLSIAKAKVQIGQKILNGIGDNIPSVLASSREAGNRCQWADTTYSYEDAEELAGVWGTSVDGAKSKVADYVTNGQSMIVNRALGHGPT